MGVRNIRSIGWAPNIGKMLDDGVRVYAACSRFCGNFDRTAGR